MAAVERFDIEKVTEVFKRSLQDEDDVLMEAYLEAYKEINKFFQLMGTVFSFVSSDVSAKLDILEELVKKEESREQFFTICRMMAYEKEVNLLNDDSYVSGCRTLLRLHRGLEFLYEFLNRLSGLSETDKTHTSCKTAYNDTLAKFHPWVVRKAALVAMYALPTQGELLKRVCVNVPRAIEMLPDMLKLTKMVYDRTDNLYTRFELHGLR